MNTYFNIYKNETNKIITIYYTSIAANLCQKLQLLEAQSMPWSEEHNPLSGPCHNMYLII